MIKGARRVKDLIRNKTKGDSGKSQALLRHYAMERFLERLSNSPYRNNFVLKGGMLMSSLVGLDHRSTMDIDTTVKGVPLNTDSILEIMNEIAAIPLDDDMLFSIQSTREIMEDSEYGGVRVSLMAQMEKARIPMKIDVSTGDAITPAETMYHYPLMFEDRAINIWRNRARRKDRDGLNARNCQHKNERLLRHFHAFRVGGRLECSRHESGT